MSQLAFKDIPKRQPFSVEKFNGELSQEFVAYVVKAASGSTMSKAGVTIDQDKLGATIKDYAFNENKVIFLAKCEGEVIGSFMGHINEVTFTTDKMAYETYTWIMPEYRGNHIGQLMLDMFEDWATKKGCKAVVFGVDILVDKDLLPAEKMLEGSGYKFFEKKFIKVF